jgi:hypothetical protein
MPCSCFLKDKGERIKDRPEETWGVVLKDKGKGIKDKPERRDRDRKKACSGLAGDISPFENSRNIEITYWMPERGGGLRG